MTKNQRLIVLVVLTAVLAALLLAPAIAPRVKPEVKTIIFASLFLLSFSALLLEHFYARPTDVIAAGVSILLLIVPARELVSGWGVWYWFFLAYVSLAVCCATAALLCLSEGHGPAAARNRVSRFLKTVSVGGASGRLQYFWLFFLCLLFFVDRNEGAYTALLIYALGVVLVEPSRIALSLSRRQRDAGNEVGTIFGVQGASTFLVRLHPRGERPAVRVGDLIELAYRMDDPHERRRGIVVERFYLDQAQWVRVLCDSRIDAASEEFPAVAAQQEDAAYRVAGAEAVPFWTTLVGMVDDGTTVQELRFVRMGRAEVAEGDLVEVFADRGPVLYQVVNAEVDTEALEKKNEADLVIGHAIQLGRWSRAKGAFETYGWVPRGRAPVIKAALAEHPTPLQDEIVLGSIPGSDFPVLMNVQEALAHHLAVLGVTGVGKSVFARQLIRDCLSDSELRVIVVDFTREWLPKLQADGATAMLDGAKENELRKAVGRLAKEMAEFKNKRDEDEIARQKQTLYEGFREALAAFMAGQEQLRVFELPDVSNTEGVLEYTQWFFKTLFSMARDEKLEGRRVCIVLEEAHTVVPEWNFIGLSDRASQSLVNNISQIALQGRKYGIGFVVIAQRTATVSKTVLTQCNTIIAFKCFDGTSIDFLAHYFPRAVANALPSLPERRAAAFGKGIRGSVPLLFDVPEIEEARPEATGASRN